MSNPWELTDGLVETNVVVGPDGETYLTSAANTVSMEWRFIAAGVSGQPAMRIFIATRQQLDELKAKYAGPDAKIPKVEELMDLVDSLHVKDMGPKLHDRDSSEAAKSTDRLGTSSEDEAMDVEQPVDLKKTGVWPSQAQEPEIEQEQASESDIDEKQDQDDYVVYGEILDGFQDDFESISSIQIMCTDLFTILRAAREGRKPVTGDMVVCAERLRDVVTHLKFDMQSSERAFVKYSNRVESLVKRFLELEDRASRINRRLNKTKRIGQSRPALHGPDFERAGAGNADDPSSSGIVAGLDLHSGAGAPGSFEGWTSQSREGAAEGAVFGLDDDAEMAHDGGETGDVRGMDDDAEFIAVDAGLTEDYAEAGAKERKQRGSADAHDGIGGIGGLDGGTEAIGGTRKSRKLEGFESE